MGDNTESVEVLRYFDNWKEGGCVLGDEGTVIAVGMGEEGGGVSMFVIFFLCDGERDRGDNVVEWKVESFLWSVVLM